MKKLNMLISVMLLGIDLSCWSETTSPAAFIQVSGASSAPASAKSLTPAKKSSGASTHMTINVDQAFTQQMAKRAGLDPAQPELSSDGLQSTENLASSECLLAETLIMQANGFHTEHELQNFCDDAKMANTAQKVDAVRSRLEEHAGTRIDDALIHIVSWNKGKATGAWYHYNRHANGWSGRLLPFSSGDPVSSIDHLLGHGNVAFLAIHLGIDESCNISYDITAERKPERMASGVNELIQRRRTGLIEPVN